MSNKANQPTAAEAEAARLAAEAEAGLVTVWKNGESLKVHPSCVAAHTAAGWIVKE